MKNFLKGWNFNLARDKKRRKQEIGDQIDILEELEEENPLDLNQAKNRMELKVELFRIVEEEELYWFKRSHESWLLKGDNNTAFFHWVASGRKRSRQSFPWRKVLDILLE